MEYRIGLDLGSNSIGWCALELRESGRQSDGDYRYAPCRLIDAGVRILTPNEEAGRDPQSKSSLATQRRGARAARRRRDRFLRRQRRLMQVLIEAGLMPADAEERKRLEKLDPYWLRAAALNGALPLHEIGRAIFHLNQRRGFASNRIADSDDSEKSAMKAGMRALEEALAAEGARTLGELLARRHRRDRHGHRLKDGDDTVTPAPVRFRPTAQGAKNLYDFYPTRSMIADELRKIWSAQAAGHSVLTEALLARIEHIVIDQRPLKKPAVGRCTLRPEAQPVEAYGLPIDLGERAPKAHPLFQRFRILADTANLRIARPGRGERYLTTQEHKAIVAKLMSSSGSTVDFEALRRAAKLPDDARFNFEMAGRKGFPPDQTAAKLGTAKAFGKKRWAGLPRDRQIETVERLLAVEDPDLLIDWLCDAFDLAPETAETISERTRLPQGHGQFGRAALAELVDIMESRTFEAADPSTGEIYERPIRYDEAVEAMGMHHSNMRGDGSARRLPYYGEALTRHVIAKPDAPQGTQERIGRVPNPTVHIALNQMRQIVNALIAEYGPPTEIVLELGRELKLNKQRKDEIQRENRANDKANEERRECLARIGIADSHDARLRLRLFDELPADERICVYSGAPLSVERLFDGSVDIDHVLPFSRTLDDGFMNKVLCTREVNRRKGNRAPADVWSGEELAAIVERAERLFSRKAWRFQPDAMQKFAEDGGFLARQLVDTQHMARLAKTYLEQVSDPDRVWAVPGRLTAMLRAKWGLNSLLPDHNYANTGQPKNRKDHRHHAIDAFVVACTDRGLLNRMARASGQAEDLDIDRLFAKDGFPDPWEGFRDELAARVPEIVVSHKPDHGLAPGAQDNVGVTSGQLHEATAYGVIDEEIDGKRYNLVTRKPIAALSAGEIGRVRDAGLREALQRLIAEATPEGGKLSDPERRDLLDRFGQQHGIRRVRVVKTEESVRMVRHTDSAGKSYEKALTPGDNHRVEIFALPDGSWGGEGVTVHDANRPGYRPKWHDAHPGARLVMRVHNGDLIEAGFGDSRQVYRVYRLEPSAKRIRLAGHNEAGSINDRHNDPEDPLRWVFGSYERLREAGARRVRVDPLGRVTPVAAERA